ncbi:MAG: chromosome segregation protein SMC [Planctomycetes bacterium]|nr:chromosome segregation protein SMC [Planctomycetota bacterium]
MHLKRLEIVGFKSFADKTVLNLDTGVTAFVGPNGSGKSNIVDAIRWALGEQSAKRLRGGAMQDVIFAGSAARKASNFAEVTLIMDNHDRTLPVDYNEVAVTRRLFSSGDSEYLINRQTCRLKDVRELFLGTGVGGGSYNIIEQGKVDALLQAGPLERRRVIEEVAGISGYKMRRDLAKRKLERLDMSLEAVRTVLAEVERRLRSLARQVGKARRYREYREELSTLELDVSARRLGIMEAEFKDVTAGIEKLREELAALDASVAEIEAVEMDESRIRAGLADRLQAAETSYRDTVVAAERSRSLAASAGRTAVAEQERIGRLEAELAVLSEKLGESSRLAEELFARRATLAAGVEEERAIAACGAGDVEQMGAELKDIEAAVDELRQKAYRTAAERSASSNRSQDAAGRALSLRRRMESSGERAAAVEARRAGFAARAEACQAAAGGAARIRQALDGLCGRLRKRVERSARRERTAERISSRVLRSAAGLESRLEMLEQMRVRREGFSGDLRTFVERAGGRGIRASVLGEMLSVPVEYRKAVEAALDGLLGTVVVDEFTPALLEGMTENRIDLYPGGPRGEGPGTAVPAAGEEGVTPVLDVVKCPTGVQRLVEDLLGQVLIIHASADVNDVRANHPEATLVTVNGEMLRPCGMLSIRRGEALAGVIGRSGEIAAVGDLLVRARARAVKRRARKADMRLGAAVERRDAAAAEASRLGRERDDLRRQAEGLRRENEIICGERDSIGQEADAQEALALEEAGRVTELIDAEKAVIAELEARLSELGDVRGRLEAVRDRAGRQAAELARLEEQLKAHDGETAAVQRSADESAAGVERVRSEMSIAERRVSESRAEEAAAREDLAELVTKADGLKRHTSELAAERARLDAEREERSARRRGLEKEISVKRDDMQEKRLRENSLVLNRANLIQDVLERYNRDLGEVAAGLEGPVEAPREEEVERIAELKRRMASLGNVNVSAIEEEDELRERRDFVKGEIKDLETARMRLYEAIERLDSFCRERFSEALEKVAANFQELFRKLFQGGDVKLRLLEGDVLEAGLEVVVRPPGKEPRILSLLSGGEKAMTAIALIMAAFKASPSPFCLLDEVDGPLDEANVERLNMIVQEFAYSTQFVLITHNKLTMTYADTIYGVAMEEAGISKYLKTDLVRADENLAVAD